MRQSLRFRLFLVVTLVVVAVAGGVALAATQITSRTLHGYEDRRVALRDRRFAGFLSTYYGRHGNWAGVQQEVEEIGQITGERVVLAGKDGLVVADTAGDLIGRPPGPGWGTPGVPVVHGDAAVGGLFVGPPPARAGIEAMLASTNRTLLLVAVGAGTGAVLLILGLSRRILGPVENLTRAATRMAAGNLDQRVDVASEDEIGALGRAFNRMAAGLSRQEELRRNMVTDVAHELRTPLTNIRGYLQAISDGLIEPQPEVVELLRDEAELLGDLVDDLQDLSLAEAGQLTLERQVSDVSALTIQAASAFRSRAEAKGVSLTTHLLASRVPANVDARRIGQVMRNLLENALTHTPPGGRIAVTARPAGRDGIAEPAGVLEIRVRDTGDGIAPGDLPHVFDRFYRADRSRSRATGGAGLGLAIAKQIVEAHGGRIRAESEAGGGTAFTITLPLVSADGV